MRREKNIQLINTLHPNIRSIATSAIEQAEELLELNTAIHITQALRTFKEQAGIYAQGRTRPGKIVTNAKPGQSFHNYGLAFDIALNIDGKIPWIVNDDWLMVADVLKKWGFKWGGDFVKLKDYPHFEMTFGLTWRQCFLRHNQKLFLPKTEYIKIANECV